MACCEEAPYPRDKLTIPFHGTNLKIHNMCANIVKKNHDIHNLKRNPLHDKAYEAVWPMADTGRMANMNTL